MPVTSTLTVPLTTVFTAPASCSSHWTYEAQFYNSIAGGLLLQNALPNHLDTACFPAEFLNNGRLPSAQVYSPGVCPSGYTTPAILQNAGTTTAICCQTGFSYFTTYTTINFYESSSLLFAGCVSTYFESNTATTVLGRANNTDLNTTTLTGPITMWGQPVTVQFQPQDLRLYTTTVSSSSSATSSSAIPSATSATQLAASTTTSSPANTASAVPTNSLPTGAIAGISIGAVAILLIFLSLAILLIRRKRRTRTTPVVPLEYQDEVMPRKLHTQTTLVEAPDGMARPRELHGDYPDRNGKGRTSARWELQG